MGCDYTNISKLVKFGRLPVPQKLGNMSLWPEKDLAPIIREYRRQRANGGHAHLQTAFGHRRLANRKPVRLLKVKPLGYCEPWWRIWNRQFGTALTRDDAERISRRVASLVGAER